MPRPFCSYAQLRDPVQSGLKPPLKVIGIKIRIGRMRIHCDALKPDSIWFNVHWVSSVDRPLSSKTVLLCHIKNFPITFTLPRSDKG